MIVDDKHNAAKALVSKGWMRFALGLCLVGLPALLCYCSYQLIDSRATRLLKDETALAWAASIKDQKAGLERVKQEALAQLQGLTRRLAILQARLGTPEALIQPGGNPAVPQGSLTASGQTEWQSMGSNASVHAWLPSTIYPGLPVWRGLTTLNLAPGYQIPIQLYKHGRNIDPASYIHSTIR